LAVDSDFTKIFKRSSSS